MLWVGLGTQLQKELYLAYNFPFSKIKIIFPPPPNSLYPKACSPGQGELLGAEIFILRGKQIPKPEVQSEWAVRTLALGRKGHPKRPRLQENPGDRLGPAAETEASPSAHLAQIAQLRGAQSGPYRGAERNPSLQRPLWSRGPPKSSPGAAMAADASCPLGVWQPGRENGALA